MWEKIKNWKTTLMGVLLSMIPILVGIGVINADQAEQLSELIKTIIEGLSIVIPSAASLWLIFKSKDKE